MAKSASSSSSSSASARGLKKAAAGVPSRPHPGAITTDPRFARLHTDPRFLKPKRDDTKVAVDERFKGLFTDSKAIRKTDKYGRKLKKGQTDADQVKRFYRLEDEGLHLGNAPPLALLPNSADGVEEEEDSDKEDAATGTVDYARGEGDLESSSEEEFSADEDEDSDESSSDDEDSGEDGVIIGPSSVLDRERKKKLSRSSWYEDEDEDSDGLGSDIGEIDLEEEVDESVFAQLDAEAQTAIAEGGIEGDSESEDASTSRTSTSKGKSKGKDRTAKKPKSRAQKIPTGDDTHRLAVVNLDWDHVRAKDIYKVFTSIVSPLAIVSAAEALKATRRASSSGKNAPAIAQVRGKLLSVRVYPSEFGKERMAKEDIEGPPPEIFKGSRKRRGDDSESESEEEEEVTSKNIFQVDEGGEFDEEALRRYQLERLRYYYAVATFDSKETARHVYNEIDGTEMERTANVFDLRFVPDGMEFPDGEDGRDAEYRDEATDDVANYKGVDFKTDALRHSRVKLTWDQDDPERSKLTKLVARGGLTKEQLRDDDFRAYLASDNESDADAASDAENGKSKAGRDRLRALLESSGVSSFGGKGGGKRNGGVFDDPRHDDEDGQGEMQITFLPGLSEAAAKKAGISGKKQGEDETTLENYMRKQKEKKERRKAKRSETEVDGNGENVQTRQDSGGDGTAIHGNDAVGFDDPFFNSDDMDMEAALAAEFGDDGVPKSGRGKGSKKMDKKAKALEPVSAEEKARMQADLRSVIGDTNDELTPDGRQHFDMKDIVRVESGKEAKRAKILRKLSKKKQRQEEEFQERRGAPLVQDTFEVDAKDTRFNALMDDHRFAIDPTHPSFSKTKAMQKIMNERRQRLDAVNAGQRPVGKNAARDVPANEDDISALVEKLKRRRATDISNARPLKKKQKAAV